MFYRPQDGHGLPHNPFNAIVSPRPIGWISTRSAGGHDNLAPYSFFNAVAYEPPQVMFASSGRKDSLTNVEETGVFCINLVGTDAAHIMNLSSAPLAHAEDEFAHSGAAKTECAQIACARVADAPATLECKVTQIVRLEGADNYAVFGQVVGIHMRDDCIVDGRFDVVKARMLSRLGYRDYAEVKEVFELVRPE
ncbi:flavin reductase family protein [Celeribacter marinus]|uniref:Nitrilotriacetate monooxygenase component B n=1 Tax=Celeribacter marinus TaxID=1397108 RepID=A0A0N9ZLN4_9RHOB|nr:flavin reductase family protein [Celeribacter marinus]ALI56607.1 nitrilotriacetate monooxygenase component B [Celeribacter marinus]SFK60365.1 NADH-FMN oxidoreductase RutF, flavin reductase (DIM6/NTAB) family [Celeribacter marinus]